MRKPPDVVRRLAGIQRELEEAVHLCSQIPLDINHPNLLLSMYKVQCCRNRLLRLRKLLPAATQSPPVSVLTP